MKCPILRLVFQHKSCNSLVSSYFFQLPVITNLRNQALKPRHWEHIQQIFGYHFTEKEPLTLGLLNKIDAFDHTEAIEEVSGQASSEASLEGILKKVKASSDAG